MPQRPDPGGGHLWCGLAALLSSLRELTQEKDLALLPHDPPKTNIFLRLISWSEVVSDLPLPLYSRNSQVEHMKL